MEREKERERRRGERSEGVKDRKEKRKIRRGQTDCPDLPYPAPRPKRE